MSGIDKTSTVLLLHGEDFTDSSLNPKSITNVGTTINTNGKFGKGLTFGSGQYLKISNGLQGVDLSKDFTIEWWEYSTGASSSTAGVFTNRTEIDNDYARGLLLGFNGVYLYAGNNDWNVFNSAPFKDKVDNVWVHWRLVKKGNLWTSYKNGTKFWSGTSNLSPLSFGDVCTVGAAVGPNISSGYNAIIDEFRISNVALCDSNFELPTKPFNLIDINITNQTKDKIDFNITNLGQETINKVDLLINNEVVQTYSEIGDLSYIIDENIMTYGNNDIKIRVTFDDIYTEEIQTIYRKEVKLETFDPLGDLLPTTSLSELIQRFDEIRSVNDAIINNLSLLLESKGFAVGENPRLSSMVNLVNELSNNNSTEITEYINRITELESEKATLNQNIITLNNTIANNKTLLYNKLVSCGATGISSSNDFQSLINSMILFESKVGKTYLYQAGNECTSVTGGWTAKSYFGNGGTMTKASKYLEYGDQTTGNYGYGGFYTTNKIDLKDYRRLFIDWEIVSTKVNIYSGTNASGSTQNICGTKTSASSDSSGITQLADVSNSLNNYNLGRRITAVDLSSQTASVHIVVHSTAGYIYTDTILCRLHNMWLEK